MLTTLPPHHPPRPLFLATLLAALGAPGCGADGGAELADSDGVALGSLEQAFGEPTCATTTADAVLTRDVTYVTPAGYDHPECRQSAVLDAPDLVISNDVVNVSWWDTTIASEKFCSRQLLRASYLARNELYLGEEPDDRSQIAHAESRGEWLNGTCVMAPLRLAMCEGFSDCFGWGDARIVVSGTVNILRDSFTRMVSVTYSSRIPLTPRRR